MFERVNFNYIQKDNSYNALNKAEISNTDESVFELSSAANISSISNENAKTENDTTEQNGNTTTYKHNDDGSVSAQITDENGNLKFDITVNSEGKTIYEKQYDETGMLKSFIQYDGTDEKNIVYQSDFSTDSSGILTQTEIQNTYDDKNNLIYSEYSVSENSVLSSVSQINYDYDENGNMTAQTLLTDEDNDGNFDYSQNFSYEYDSDGFTSAINSETDKNLDGIADTKEKWQLYDDGSTKSYENINDSNLDGNFDEKFSFEYNQAGDITSQTSSFEIDKNIENSKQGELGDCYILAGLNNLSYSEKGKQLIADSLQQNDNGSYTVNFKGSGDSFNITEEELANARNSGEYSEGDNTVLLFELAFEKVIKNVEKNPEKYPSQITDIINASANKQNEYTDNILNYGNLELFTYFLTGEKSEMLKTEDNSSEVKNALDNFNAENEIININFENDSSNGETIEDTSGNTVNLTSAHSWSLKNSDENTLVLVNPWDSTKEITLNKTAAEKVIKYIEISQIPND